MNTVTVIRALAIALLLSGPAVRVASGAERALTLDEAIRMALRRNEALVIERESLVSATAGVKGARGVYDPVLELSGGWSRSTEPVNSAFSGAPAGRPAARLEGTEAGGVLRQLLPTGGALSVSAQGARQTSDGVSALLSPAFSTRLGVELRQPLLRDLAMDDARLRVRVASAGRHAALAAVRQSLSETIAAVEKAYWDLVAAREGVGVREDAVRLAAQQLEETRARVGTGDAPGTELSQPRAELERRRGELLAEREALARADNALKLLILSADASQWVDALAPSDSVRVDARTVDVDAALRRAVVARPELDEARAVVERRRAERERARSGVWPSLDAVASYDRFGLAGSRNPASAAGAIAPELDGDLAQSFRTLRDGDLDATRVALVLGLPIRNRAASAALVVARSAERQAEAALDGARKAIYAEVLDAAAALETAGQRVAAARAGREAAEIQLSAERDRYSTGLSTNFLVLTRQNDLSRARLDEISARADYLTARTELARATGSLVEDHGIDLEPSNPE
ncbi:MAG TPA: TolC family protein [Candidatus Eisenbacteria bacterium]